jgi:hypothetical protein
MVWNTGATGYNLSELSPGTYTLTVTDSYGCQAVDSVVMVQPDPIMVDATVINESCPGAMDGSISLIITGGNSSYPYLYYLYFWSNGASSENISGLSADTYSVTVMDNFGCNGYGSFIVAEASAVCDSTFVTGNLTGVSCYDATQVITVAGNGQTFVVESGASATFIAGAKIRFLTGTQVLPGGYMLGRIAPSGPFCAPTKLTEVAHSAEIPMVSAGKQHLLLYPNPVSGNFRLLFREIPEQGTVSVEVFNLNGERIRTFPWDSADQEFETTGLPVGLYMVRVKTNNWVEMIKLVKNR